MSGGNGRNALKLSTSNLVHNICFVRDSAEAAARTESRNWHFAEIDRPPSDVRSLRQLENDGHQRQLHAALLLFVLTGDSFPARPYVGCLGNEDRKRPILLFDLRHRSTIGKKEQ